MARHTASKSFGMYDGCRRRHCCFTLLCNVFTEALVEREKEASFVMAGGIISRHQSECPIMRQDEDDLESPSSQLQCFRPWWFLSHAAAVGWEEFTKALLSEANPHLVDDLDEASN
jgi:hypothetical protein